MRALQYRADRILDWYAVQSRSIRVGLLGSVAAIGLMGVVAAASNALVPLPSGTNWATTPESTGSTLSPRVTVSAGTTPSPHAQTVGASATPQASATRLPSASTSGTAHVTGSINATHKATNATAKSSNANTSSTKHDSTVRPPAPTAEPTTAPPPAPPTEPPTGQAT